MKKLSERLFAGDGSGSINPNREKKGSHSRVILVITDGPEEIDPRRVQEVKNYMETYPGNGAGK